MLKRKNLSDFDTYVFIDASNIRATCLKTLGLKIDFKKMADYFRKKYPQLKEIRYYEGIAKGDAEKEQVFRRLEKVGYKVCSLSRKAYLSPAVYKNVRCRKCGNVWKTQLMKKTMTMKSNVDVYLATELLDRAYSARRRTHLILVSCDGDYAEMIRNAVLRNKKVSVSVLATPPSKNIKKNTLSIRLRELFNEIPRYELRDISDIRDYVS